MIAPKLSPWSWRNESGVPWPAKDEFEVGCTYEHAGYILTWLAAFFGPATQGDLVCLVPDPDKGIAVDVMAPDFTVGCIEYRRRRGRARHLQSCGAQGQIADHHRRRRGSDGRRRAQRCLPGLRAIDTAEPVAGGDRAPRQQIATVVSRLGDRMALLAPVPDGAETSARLRQRRQASGFLPRAGGAGRRHPRQAAVPALSGARMAHHGTDRTPAVSGTVRQPARTRLQLRSDPASAGYAVA